MLVLLVACGSGLPTDPLPVTPGPEGHAPFPFSVEQLRSGNPDGARWTFALETDAMGAATRTMTFSQGTETGANVHSELVVDGQVVDATDAFAAWTDLQHHALYPAEAAPVWHRVTVPAGTMVCMRYHFTDDGTETDACFAPEHAGPPVFLEQHRDATRILSMQLVSREIVAGP